MYRRLLASLAFFGLIFAYPAARQSEQIDAAMNAKIRAEAMDRSQVMRIEHFLADVFGPRLTGSPNHKNAGDWAVKTMESWGMTSGHLEPWNWGHEGWLNEEAYGSIVSPVKDNLVFEVEAWTPSTKGVVTASAVNVVTPTGPMAPPSETAAGGRGAAQGPSYLGPTEDELNRYLATMASKVKGAIVLVGAPRVPPFVEVEAVKRRPDADVRAQYDPAAPPGAGRGNRGGGRGAQPAAPAGEPVRLSTTEVAQKVAEFLMKNGAAVRVDDAYRRHGQIVAFNPSATDGVPAANRYDSSKTIPTIVLRNEDYGRIARILADGTAVTMKIFNANRINPEGRTSYNAIAEIPGADKAGEVVMLGGHLDSWHSATGATDNAIGCAIMMEAVRILEAVGARPRRTIRVALWGGEEEGLLGSLAYVAEHFGTAEAPKSEFAKFDAYWNIDTGTGRVRGASVFGPPEGARILSQIVKPWEDYGVFGASTTTSRVTGGTDSTSFNHAGLPGIGASQDPIEYNSHTHHTNLDTYERILPDDVKKAAAITASIIYHLATREEMMPRFAVDQMPPLPQGRGGLASAPASR